MKMRHILSLSVIALGALSMGAGCPTVPKIEDRAVELALGSSTTLTFPAVGIINVYNDSGTENLATDIDLTAVLADAGVDVKDVKIITLAGISYRVTVPDPNSGRTISATTISAQRGAASPVPLVTSFSQNVSAASSWQTAPLSAGGVTLINGLLTDILAAAKAGTLVSNPLVTYTVHGTSNPTSASTSFTWQLRLDLSIVGTVKVKVLN